MTEFQATVYRVQTDSEGESKLILLVPKVYLNKIAELSDLLEVPLLVQIEKADIKRGDEPTQAQFAKSEIMLQELGWDKETKEAYLLLKFKKRHRNELTKEEMSAFLDFLVHCQEEQEKGGMKTGNNDQD